MRTNTDITIFNKYTEGRETKYKKSYIKKVHWEDSKGANIIASGLTTADSTKIYIPFSSVSEYMKPTQFKENHNGITLQVEDVVVKGIIEDEFTTIKALESKYDDVRVITTVDTRDFGSPRMQHWEVGAK